MNINVSLVDQRLTGIINELSEFFALFGNDDDQKKSAAFLILCMSTLLDLSLAAAVELLTDGGNDIGVDGIYIGEIEDGEFLVSMFQAKYKRNLDGEAHFPENSIQKIINTVSILFDPSIQVVMNNKIAPKIEEIRSLVLEGYLPTVRIILCNNGQRWNESAEKWIAASGFPAEQVEWNHYNHDHIVAVLQRTKSVDESLRLEGQALVEGFNFRRVLVGKVPVSEIHGLFKRHGDRLLERNIRRYLGLRSNRVNTAIHETLTNTAIRDNFYFFNNGITIICNKFRHNALQGGNFQVKLENMQIINGGQTCKTIQHALESSEDPDAFSKVFVLVRIYELESEDQSFVNDITFATNSQNPVDLRDLKSNDEIQRTLEIGLRDLGYTYKRKDEGGLGGSNVITSPTVAESTLAIWRHKPHQAKCRRKQHFGKLYEFIFKPLSAAQVLLAVLIFRFVENERKRPSRSNPPTFIPYASHYLSMVVGQMLLAEKQMQIEDVSHQTVADLLSVFEQKKTEFYIRSMEKTQEALKQLYGDRELSLQKLSSTFRRGDLLEFC